MTNFRNFAIILSGLTMAAAPAAAQQADKGPGTHADSPLGLQDFFKPLNYGMLRTSPDGKYLVGSTLQDNQKPILHIIDRKTMKVIDSQAFDGNFSIAGTEWFDKDNLLITVSYNDKLAEGAAPVGFLLHNIHSGKERLLWNSSALGDFGGGSISGRIDHDHYWMTIYPSGATYSENPYVYLFKLDVRTGTATRVVKSPSRAASFIFDNKGQLAYSVGRRPGDFDATVVHKRVGNDWVLESDFRSKDGGCIPVRFNANDDDKVLYDCDDDAPTRGAFWIDRKTGKRELVYRNPKVDFSHLFFDEDEKPVAVSYEYDYPKFDALDLEAEVVKRHNLFQSAFPGKQVEIKSATEDDVESVLYVSDDHGPGKYYLYNKLDGKFRFLLDPNPGLNRDDFPTMYAVNFKARDGLDLVGYLTVPKQAKAAKNLPLIINPHGGPYGPRDAWGYNPEVAAFANAGYAVLQVNYRGSGGYGRKFQYDWYRHWGLEMQDDLEDATNWAIQSGIADANRICIYGASYGGYAALMGVVKTPDLYKCSIGYVGVYDLDTFRHYGDVSRSDAGRTYLDEGIGTDPADLASRSPTPNAEKIKVPVFLVEGLQDDRVFPKHYLDMKAKLKKLDHRFETLEIQRAAHGAQDRASVTEISCRMIDFFDRHIGPRKPMDPPAACKFPNSKDLNYEYFKGK